MKANILLTSMSALLVSVAGANAMTYRPFVGATIGFQGVGYSHEFENNANDDSIDLAEEFFTFGLSGGVRFGEYTQIYNGGITLNADMTTDTSSNEKISGAKVADSRTTNLTATYDNYIRISGDKMKRIDLVLGAGLGTMNYHIDVKDPAEEDETVWSPDFAFKAGLDFELNKHLALSVTARLFTPTRSHYAADTTYVFGGAIKYMF